MLRRAVESCVKGAAGAVALEVIIAVDGAAPGYGASLAEEHSEVVLLPSWKREGRGRARNRGLEVARGRFVKFLDDDDWLEAEALAQEVETACASGADIVAAGHLVAGSGGGPEYFAPPAFSDGIDSVLRGEAVPTAAALYRRSAIGGIRWDEDDAKLDDWQFFVQIALQSCKIVRLDQPAYTWFSHADQSVRKTTLLDNARDFYKVLGEIERSLAASGQLSGLRRKRLAQYRYKELRVLCRYDRPEFEREVSRIREMDEFFLPIDEEGQYLVRLAARVFGFRDALLIHERIRGVAKEMWRLLSGGSYDNRL